MSASDIIITKPGGVTTAEALAKKMAMIIVKPIPGQEASNTAYLMEMGAAVKADSAKGVRAVLEGLLSDRRKLAGLRNSAEKISKPNASFDIARLLLEAADKSC
jgi:processive 1,2-diacylglycerol beta-glucosyltransferase